MQTNESDLRQGRSKYVRGSLVVDMDGDGDAFGAGLESVEGGLLVGDDEGHV
jgi:hypothetical protein